MRRDRLSFSPGGILMAALLLFFFKMETVTAMLVPAAVHELAHIAALRLLGLRIRGFRAELRGFCMYYAGYTGALGHALAAAAGPAAGFAYAFSASYLAKVYEINWLSLSAAFSFLLSIFNMLPALPLDGGRVFDCFACLALGERRGRIATRMAGLLTGAALLGIGLWLMLKGGGIALAAAAVWILLAQERIGAIVKLREIM